MPSDETLLQLLVRIWYHKTPVIIGGILGLLLSLLLIFILKPQYEASMIVSPSAQDTRMTSFIDGYQPNTSPHKAEVYPDFIRFEQSLRGVAVAALLLKMPPIKQELEQDGLWRFSKQNFSKAEELSQYLQRHVDIDPLGSTMSRRISIRHPNRDFSVQLLTLMRKTSDQLIRQSIQSDTNIRIEWLKAELQKTLNPTHRQSLVQLLMAEERKRMLLSLETPYAITVVEEAFATPKPISPNKTILISLSIVVGVLMGAIWSLFLSYRRDK
jgi:uncharacterized protein involved in exopolysaccharide biosynthesis